MTERPVILGVINVTPDSFSDGGECLDPAAAVARGLALLSQGADILDVGALQDVLNRTEGTVRDPCPTCAARMGGRPVPARVASAPVPSVERSSTMTTSHAPG